jgi:hypothetical protein
VGRAASQSRTRNRVLCLAVGVVSVTAGIIAGCGIDVAGSLDLGTEASIETPPSLPPGNDGSIVTDGGTDADADGDAQPPLTCADSLCVTNGGRCEDGGNDCIIECNEAGTNCTGPILCPPGVGCRVVCAFDKTCAQKVDCTQATSCDVACTGMNTCAGVACAGKSCKVTCSGVESCKTGTIDCTSTDSCTIACSAPSGMMNCKEAVTCTSATCNVTCDDDACKGGVTATTTGDASIVCGDNACTAGETCYAKAACRLVCKSGGCAGKLCCDSGACFVDGGANKCPP